jgi:hypothetical protein
MDFNVFDGYENNGFSKIKNLANGLLQFLIQIFYSHSKKKADRNDRPSQQIK